MKKEQEKGEKISRPGETIKEGKEVCKQQVVLCLVVTALMSKQNIPSSNHRTQALLIDAVLTEKEEMGRPSLARGVCARLRAAKKRAQRAPFRICPRTKPT